jgi:predicted kinase
MTFGRGEDACGTTIVLMCGLPASGKTTTAMRLHARSGGVLIRSCDIYQELGIVLPEWVERTAGFTTNVTEYDRVRDSAYVEMARRVDLSVAKGSPLVIIDAVHGERAKRQRLYEISASRGATPFLIVCICPDLSEVQRRFHAREGREAEPEREASDLSVFHDIRRRWESPLEDELSDGTRPPIVIYDTLNRAVARIPGAVGPIPGSIEAALATEGALVPAARSHPAILDELNSRTLNT